LEEARRKQTEFQVEELQAKARSFSRQERFEEALSAWQELLKIAPEQSHAIQAEMDRLQPARELAKAYAEAQVAYAKKDYNQAVNLFKGIINQDENYKDASRLLAQAIEMRRARRRWWHSQVLWGAAGILVVAAVAWFAFRPGSPLTSLLFAPALQPTRMEVTTITATPIPSSSPEQINAFAQPILDAIANKKPDYTEDFSDPNSGWPSGTFLTGPNGSGERGYIDGEYFLRAPFLPSGQCCLDSNGGSKPPPQFTDFVMTVDFRFISGDAGSGCIDSRRIWENQDLAWYTICFSLEGNFGIDRNSPATGVQMANGVASTFMSGPAPNHIKMIARGSQMAYFLNDEPLEMVYDDKVKSGAFGFWMESDTSTPLEVRYDNLKVWDIAHLH
jgi:hypothetical protein